MAGNEQDVAYQWIQSTLAGDVTLASYAPGGVWRADAENGSATPYITITFQPDQSRDVFAFGGVRVYSDLYFEVVAGGPAKNLPDIASAAKRIDELLAVSEQTAIIGGMLLSSYRTQPFATDPLIDGERWNANGGIYRLMVQAS